MLIPASSLQKAIRNVGWSLKAVLLLWLAISYSISGGVSSEMAHFNDRLSRHGVTWSFSQPEQYGRYANGDYWVVGPVTITSITPISSINTNGTVLNPRSGRQQGFDYRIQNNTYIESLNIASELPYTVAAGTSVLSAISHTERVTRDDPQLKAYALLTVVENPPPEGAFRPAYLGPDKRSRWTESDLDYEALAKKSVSGMGAPRIQSFKDPLGMIINEQERSWTGRYLHASEASPAYGRDIARITNTYLLLLNSDASDRHKRDLLIGMVQYGIDIYGVLEQGGEWHADGGHNCGRLAPFLVAAATLKDPGMLSMLDGSKMRFQEYQQTFYVQQKDVDTPRSTQGRVTRRAYTAADIGKPEWGMRNHKAPDQNSNDWSAPYRDIAGGLLPAIAVAAQLMGMEEHMNHPALFDYARRHFNYRNNLFVPGRKGYSPNGYDDGHAYGEGNSTRRKPFEHNETPRFQSAFYAKYAR